MKRLSTILVPLFVVACENPAFHNLPEIAPPNDEAGDNEPPTFTNAAATPVAANDGAHVTLVFEASEELPSEVRDPASNPEVTVDGQPMTCAANGNSYSCGRDINATSETEGTKSFAITAMDASGNEVVAVDPGVTVDYDFTPPTLTVSADVAMVAPGGTVIITVTSNEPLSAAPTLNTVFLASVSNCPSFDGNITFHCEGIVDMGASLGPAVVTATGADVAGNVATSPPLAVTITDQPLDAFTIGGTVSGLSGSGLVLQNNGGNDLAITGDGPFAFTTALDDTTSYVVTILVQPSNPDQVCTLTNATGAVSGANVTNVAVTCSTDTFPVGVTVTGLEGDGLVLQNNGGNDLSIPADGSHQFSVEVADGAGYAVTVSAQPTDPAQVCAPTTGGTGTITGGPVNVAILCSTGAFTVGGNVSGLTGSGLILQLNGSENLPIAGNGDFTFTTPLPDTVGYAVTVATQPSGPTQTCTIANDSGDIDGANITDVAVTCSTSSFTVGGTVIGLVGTGMELQNNGGDTLSISGSGTVSFTFDTALADGAEYDVTVSTQPAGQDCSVSAGNDFISGGNATSVVINCQDGTYTIGGNVTGLSPLSTGLVLQNNGGDNLAVSTPGSFTFLTAMSPGTYAVTILTQPTSPNQVCSITSGGSGTVNTADITSVIINCTTTTYAVRGTITGLMGSGLVLQNNGGGDLPASGTAFLFPALDDRSAYAVTVLDHPSTPQQTCTVTDGAGIIDGAEITDIVVACVHDPFTVGGTVSGLDGTVVLQNGSETLPVSTDGSFTFTEALFDMASYSVSVSTHPSNPGQTCVVTDGTGTINAANVGDVIVNCTTNLHEIRGRVSGLATGNSVVLHNNGGDAETVSINNVEFAFDTPIEDGETYSVIVATHPTDPNQVCTVENGSGTVLGGNVTNITVSCATEQYSVGGVVTGLAVDNVVTLRLNSGKDLPVAYTGSPNVGFTFPTELNDREFYTVSVATQPTTPNQDCVLTAESGQIDGADIIGVIVTCTVEQYSVGGSVNGLLGTVVLQNNGAGDLSITNPTPLYAFPPQDDGSPYSVTVLTHPVGQSCSVANPSGNVNGVNVINVHITCSNSMYTVGGTVSGLATDNIVALLNNGADIYYAGDNGQYTFATPLMTGNGYNVSVSTGGQPTTPSQTCTISDLVNDGTIGSANVTDVDVVCITDQFTVGGGITGLTGSGMVLQNNGSGNLSVGSSDSSYLFPPQDDETPYEITILTQPSGQTCTVTNYDGVLAGINVSNANVNCGGIQYTVGGTVSGLLGTGLILNDGTNGIAVDSDGPFTFPPVDVGTHYVVTVTTQPPSPPQICTVENHEGDISSANITNVTVTCVDDPPPTVTVYPLAGSPISNSQSIEFTFSEEVDPLSLVISGELLLLGHTENWTGGNTILTISPSPPWTTGVLQDIQFTVDDLVGATAEVVVYYDVITTSSVIYVDVGSGSDTVTCGASTTPCASIAHGLSRAVADGREAVFVHSGTYDETRMCNGVETAVVMPPDVELYGGFTDGFSLAARDPATHVTIIEARGVTGSPPPPLQITAYDDLCDGTTVNPNQQTVVDGFQLDNYSGAVAFFADRTGTLRTCEVNGDVEFTSTNAIVGMNRINGHVTMSGGGTPWLVWNDIATTGTAVTVSGFLTAALVEGNVITMVGSGATGIRVTSCDECDIYDNEIDLTGATTGLYGVHASGDPFIEANTIRGVNGNSSGGWGVYGGDDVTDNLIVLDGSAGDLYGVQDSWYCQGNTIVAAAATGTTYGISNCGEVWSNTLRTSSNDAFDFGVDGSDTVSFNTISVDTGVAIRADGTDVTMTNNVINTNGGTGMTFASAPTTYTIQLNQIYDADTGIELTSGTGDVDGNDIYDCVGTAITNAGTTGTMTVNANYVSLVGAASAVSQSNSAATMTVVLTGNNFAGGTNGFAITATNSSHIVRDNFFSADLTGTTMTNGNYGVRLSDGAGGTVEDNIIGYPQVGVWLDDDAATTTLRNNVVTGRYAVVITNAAGGTDSHDLYNNTLAGRVGLYLDGDLDVDVINNIIAGADLAEHGIYVNAAAATPTTVSNNDIYDFPTVYRSANASDCATANECTLTEMETAITASGNVELDPVFVRFGGTDGDPTTDPLQRSDNYDLTTSSPCDVREGGRDGSSWGFTDDLAGTTRSTTVGCAPGNAGADHWSMGAYELDNP